MLYHTSVVARVVRLCLSRINYRHGRWMCQVYRWGDLTVYCVERTRTESTTSTASCERLLSPFCLQYIASLEHGNVLMFCYGVDWYPFLTVSVNLCWHSFPFLFMSPIVGVIATLRNPALQLCLKQFPFMSRLVQFDTLVKTLPFTSC